MCSAISAGSGRGWRHEQQFLGSSEARPSRRHHWQARAQVDHGADHARLPRRGRRARSRGRARPWRAVARADCCAGEARAVAVGVAIEVRAQRAEHGFDIGRVHAAAPERGAVGGVQAREPRRLPGRRSAPSPGAGSRSQTPKCAFSMACSQRRCSTVGFGMNGVPVFEGSAHSRHARALPIARGAPPSRVAFSRP